MIGDAAERAYRRSYTIDKRRLLMNDWNAVRQSAATLPPAESQSSVGVNPGRWGPGTHIETAEIIGGPSVTTIELRRLQHA